MTYDDLRTLLSTDPRFASLSNPMTIDDIIRKLDRVMSSGKIKDESKRFLDTQVDLGRYVRIARNVASLPISNHNRKGSLQDVNLITNPRDPDDTTAKDILIDDMKSFYYELDILTDGKHCFIEKVTKLLDETTFIPEGRSGVGTTYDDKGNLVEKHINIETKPIVNNRTVMAHEMWHGMDEKNINNISDQYPDQFIGEIGTMFIDKLSLDYMLKTYGNDPDLVEKLKYLNSPEHKMDEMIIKAKQSYAEYLVVLAVAGDTPQIRENAMGELLSNVGKLWDARAMEWLINELYDIATNPKKHFDPMYELRYVVGKAVSDSVYDMNLPLRDKIDLMVELNDNIVNISNLGSESLPLDIVTTHFGLPDIETLVDNVYLNPSATQNNRPITKNPNIRS